MTKGVITMNKKIRPLLITALVSALFLLALVAAALAAPPDFCGDDGAKPDHPSCSDTPDPEPEPPPLAACKTTMTIEGNGNVIHDCLWTPISGVSDVGTVKVSDIEGGIKKAPVVFVRDDDPGDICALEQGWVGQPGDDYEVSFDLAYGVDLPEGYDAWKGHSYWDFVWQEGMEPGTHWCAPQDFVLDSLRLDDNGTPLHLSVRFNAGKGGQLVIELSPAQE